MQLCINITCCSEHQVQQKALRLKFRGKVKLKFQKKCHIAEPMNFFKDGRTKMVSEEKEARAIESDLVARRHVDVD